MKYKIGDLVELSAAGKKRGHNSHCQGKMGLLLDYEEDCSYPYVIRWFATPIHKGMIPMKEYEIKRVGEKRGRKK